MKHGRKLTRNEKLILVRLGLDPKDYLRVRRAADDVQFIHIRTKETRWERR